MPISTRCFPQENCQIKGEGLDLPLRNIGLPMFFLLETADFTQVSELKAWCVCFIYLFAYSNSVCSNKNWCQEAERHHEIH